MFGVRLRVARDSWVSSQISQVISVHLIIRLRLLCGAGRGVRPALFSESSVVGIWQLMGTCNEERRDAGRMDTPALVDIVDSHSIAGLLEPVEECDPPRREANAFRLWCVASQFA